MYHKEKNANSPMLRRFGGGILAALGLLLGCRESPEALPKGMTLIWSDEFDYEGAPDPDKWDYSLGAHGWGNAEEQDYTNSRDNSAVGKGLLEIRARNENGRWTSARLKTQHKAQWTYGYFEIRAKLPEGRGTWPAIWMLPSADRYGPWPRSGEIDIMEHVGHDQDRVHTTAHTGAFNHTKNTQKTASLIVENASRQFHVYAVEWRAAYIQWYIDGEAVFRFDNSGIGAGEEGSGGAAAEAPNTASELWPFDIPFYLILNIAIGGSWGGQQGIDPGLQEAVMQVDYVRVYMYQ
ncbi:MAG: glycoside hydrolase family 16 protein [Treponema sp.]|nr:glycoside hydrolase family 16 protein [Treponema sp.]